MRQETFPGPFELECGESLPELKVAYHLWGDPSRQPVIWVFHALTANSDVSEWWPELFGNGKLLDPDKFCILCANMLGSPYGTTHSGDFPSPEAFPLITIKDMVAAHRLLADKLGIGQISLGIGGSMGGQQLLEWSVQEPGRFSYIVPLATNARHSPWGIAFNETQRMSILAGRARGGEEGARMGLEAARAIALLSYRHYHAYRLTQSEDSDEEYQNFKASSYQQYQGLKLSRRFDAHSYFCLTRAMDSHNLGRGWGGVDQALSRITAKTMIIGIDSDLLFPLAEQVELAEKIPDARLYVIESTFGHDGFLVELESIGAVVMAFLEDRIEGAAFSANGLAPRLGSIALPGSETF